MSKIEQLRDRSNPSKWAHPEFLGYWENMTGSASVPNDIIFNFDLPFEQRLAAVTQIEEQMKFIDTTLPDNIVKQTVVVSGCPEDPEATVELVIYRTAESVGKKRPVVYSIPGGGLYLVMVEALNLWKLAERNDCIVISPRYSSVFEATFPTQMNQLHAGYQYIVEHSNELGVRGNNIVLHGISIGSTLALSLAHRLKRYGYRPKGCVVEATIADNRPIFPTSPLTFGIIWDGVTNWRSSQMYLGLNNYGALNTPEMYPNYATAEDCIGLCPTFIHAETEESSASSIREYCDKLTQAGVYNELHVWGGSCHSGHVSMLDGGEGQFMRCRNVIDGNIRDCFTYDLRRLWIEDELGE